MPAPPDSQICRTPKIAQAIKVYDLWPQVPLGDVGTCQTQQRRMTHEEVRIADGRSAARR